MENTGNPAASADMAWLLDDLHYEHNRRGIDTDPRIRSLMDGLRGCRAAYAHVEEAAAELRSLADTAARTAPTGPTAGGSEPSGRTAGTDS